MITYCYSNSDGRVVEWRTRMGMAPQALFCNGRTYFRDLRAEHTSKSFGDPWVNHASLSMMVHPLDVKKYQQDAKNKGLGVIDFDVNGMPHFTSDKHQKRYAEAYGFRQLNSYY